MSNYQLYRSDAGRCQYIYTVCVNFKWTEHLNCAVVAGLIQRLLIIKLTGKGWAEQSFPESMKQLQQRFCVVLFCSQILFRNGHIMLKIMTEMHAYYMCNAFKIKPRNIWQTISSIHWTTLQGLYFSFEAPSKVDVWTYLSFQRENTRKNVTYVTCIRWQNAHNLWLQYCS